MNKSVIVDGEASETDSEEEQPKTDKVDLTVMTTSVQGAVISGEDSESENEFEASIASAVSALHVDLENVDNDSLLHQKLREKNGKLKNEVENFCQNLVCEAGKNLNVVDQQLIKSQLSLQGAVNSLKSLNNNSVAIKNKLQSMLTADFFNNIKIKR